MYGFDIIEIIESSISIVFLLIQFLLILVNSLQNSFTVRLVLYLILSTAILYMLDIINISTKECNCIFILQTTFEIFSMLISSFIGLTINWSINMKLGYKNQFINPKRREVFFVLGFFLNGLIFGLIPVLTEDVDTIYDNYCWISTRKNKERA